MGPLAFCKGLVFFETEDKAKIAESKFVTWAKEVNKGKLGEDCYIPLAEICLTLDTITYSVYSDREQNCVSQCQQILEFWKTLEGSREVSQSIMSFFDSVDWTRERRA